MELDTVVEFLRAWGLLLGSFGVALAFSMFKGRQNLINVMMGLYLALLLHQLFPFTNTAIEQVNGERGQAMVSVGVFLALAFLGTWLFIRLMPREFLEGPFETMGKKLLLSIAFMILFLTLSWNYLPVGDIINTGTPLPTALQTEKLAFLWLVLPLVAMFI